MKTIRLAGSLLALLALTAFTLPLPTGRPAVGARRGQAALWRYCRRWGAQRAQVLAWLRANGPFTQPPPGMLAADAPTAPAATGPLGELANGAPADAP